MGDTPKPPAGKYPCTLLGFRILDLARRQWGFAPLHALISEYVGAHCDAPASRPYAPPSHPANLAHSHHAP